MISRPPGGRVFRDHPRYLRSYLGKRLGGKSSPVFVKSEEGKCLEAGSSPICLRGLLQLGKL